MNSTVYLICGLGGSGKSTYSQKLADDGMMKFSIDEYVYSIHGRSITTLPEHEYLEIYRVAKIELDNQLAEAIQQNQKIVVLLKRLKERNKLTHANAFPVSEEKLEEYIARFEEPNGEGEEILLQT